MKRHMLIAFFTGLFLWAKKADADLVQKKLTDPFRPDLPVKITPAKEDAGNIVAVMISGDGGWTDLDQDMANALSNKNVPVVGLNALKYFWKKKSQQQTTHDLTQLIEHYSAIWHKDRVIMLGYSFGADVMPFVFNRLSPAVRARIFSVGLLSPSRSTDFEVHVSDLFSNDETNRIYAVMPEIERMKHNNIFCFYGKKEAGFPAGQVPVKVCTLVALDGGHHYDKNAFKHIADRLLL